MNTADKKVGFLKGLLENLSIEDATHAKVMHGIVDLLGDLVDKIEVVDELLADLNDYVESIDDDLSLLEGERGDNAPGFGEFEDEDEDYDDEMDSAEDRLHLLYPEKQTPAEAAEPDEYAITGALCPSCMRMFFVSMADKEGSTYNCPYCGAKEIAPLALTPENTPIVPAN